MPLRVLAPIDASPWSQSSLEVALWLASVGREVEVAALHVVNVTHVQGNWLEDLRGLLGMEPIVVPERVEAYYVDRGRALLARAAAQAQARGLSLEVLLDRGAVAERIGWAAGDRDLVVLGVRGETEEAWPGQGGGTIQHVLRRLSTPALIVPHGQTRLGALALAFDGGEGAMRALGAVRHLLGALTSPPVVHVLHVAEEAPVPDPLEQARAELAGFSGELHLHRLPGEPQEALVAEAARLGCDVLAVGRHGRSRLHDLLVGTVPQRLVGEIELGLLIAP